MALVPAGGVPFLFRQERYQRSRLGEGSDGSAAGGGVSDLSEWQRSADGKAHQHRSQMPGTATGHCRTASSRLSKGALAPGKRPFLIRCAEHHPKTPSGPRRQPFACRILLEGAYRNRTINWNL